MSCSRKCDVEQMRDVLHAMQMIAVSTGEQYVKISTDLISDIVEMLDEYANGNMVEE